jgi:hypothetical protein
MGAIDEARKMIQSGRSDQETIGALLGQGFSMAEISDALSQAKIKEAVGGEISDSSEMTHEAQGNDMQRMQPSLLAAERAEQVQQEEQGSEEQAPDSPSEVAYGSAPATTESYQQPSYQQQAYQQAPQAQYPEYQQEEYSQQPQYPQYSQYQSSSSDITSEIAEQVLAEKLAPLRNKIESILDLKSSLVSKIESLDERLKRIEKILDRLQLSILQRVGEYITNVEDVKKELVETQKTFKSMHPSHQSQQHSPQHHNTQHHKRHH